MKKLGLILVSVVIVLLGLYLFGMRKAGTDEQIPVKDQIILALAQKNNWDASRVELNVIMTQGDYAKGDVKFRDEAGGGLWFAAKVNGIWKIVYDGNGIITCDLLTDYKNFPKDLIPQCFDNKENRMINR